MRQNRRKHEEHEEHVDESWLIPYADLLTLLLALFVVLFATATIDQEKYNAVMEALHESMTGEVVPVEVLPYPPQTELPSNPPPPTEEETDPMAGMNSLYRAINAYVSDNGLSDYVAIEQLGDKVMITLSNDVWFASGSKNVTAEMRDKIPVIARILRENQDESRPFEIVVAGHTDNVPIVSIPNYSNWDLSVDRAVEFLRLLLKDSGMDPAHFSARGYGEMQPVATNDTPDGRQQNRRVEVLISQFSEEED